jgi:hypothetical protein
MITTERELRRAFWDEHPQFKQVPGRRQNEYNATIRSAWVEWVDMMEKSAEITEALAQRVTL